MCVFGKVENDHLKAMAAQKTGLEVVGYKEKDGEGEMDR